jgi:hypothetical protein
VSVGIGIQIRISHATAAKDAAKIIFAADYTDNGSQSMTRSFITKAQKTRRENMSFGSWIPGFLLKYIRDRLVIRGKKDRDLCSSVKIRFVAPGRVPG